MHTQLSAESEGTGPRAWISSERRSRIRKDPAVRAVEEEGDFVISHSTHSTSELKSVKTTRA